MATNEERMMILRMVEEGKVSAEEGTRLLKALGNDENEVTGARLTDSSRHVRVLVTDLVTGKQKVSVNIPLALVAMALRFIPNSAGIDKSALFAAIDTGMTGRIIDVQDDEHGQHVEIFLE
jgi:hypothetical protein